MPPSSPDALLVVCLCAQWCNVCEQYRISFGEVQASIQADYPQTRFAWLDIEDEADLLEPLDVENFPTVLLAMGNAALFFGAITPQPQTLERLVRMVQEDPTAAAMPDEAITALAARVQGWRRSASGSAA